MGLRYDETFVESLYEGDTFPDRSLGAALTQDERAEMEARGRLNEDALAIERFVDDRGLRDKFGGTYIDNRGGGRQVVLFCEADDESLEMELRTLVPHPERLTARPCVYSRQYLDDVLARVVASAETLALDGLVVRIAAVDVVANAVAISGPPASAVDALQQQFGPAVQVNTLGDPWERPKPRWTQPLDLSAPPTGVSTTALVCTALSRQDDCAPYYAGAQISIIGGQVCTLGFALTDVAAYPNESLTAGHCDRPKPSLPWAEVYNGANKLGYVVASAFNSSGDSAILGLEVETGARVYTDYPGSLAVGGTDSGSEQVGYTRCMSGATTDYHCGELYSTNASAFTPYGTQTGMRAVKDLTPADRGDSGAPVWHPRDGKAYASGVLNVGTTISHTAVPLPPPGPTPGPGTLQYAYPVYLYEHISTAVWCCDVGTVATS